MKHKITDTFQYPTRVQPNLKHLLLDGEKPEIQFDEYGGILKIKTSKRWAEIPIRFSLFVDSDFDVCRFIETTWNEYWSL